MTQKTGTGANELWFSSLIAPTLAAIFAGFGAAMSVYMSVNSDMASIKTEMISLKEAVLRKEAVDLEQGHQIVALQIQLAECALLIHKRPEPEK